MTRNAKVILAVLVGALVVLCLCVCALAAFGSLFFINNVRISGGEVRTFLDGAGTGLFASVR